MKTIDCNIEHGRVWMVEPELDIAQEVHQCLSFDVPGREHIPLFKRGLWDGIKRFMKWRGKFFAVGLLPFVERKTQIKFNILNDTRSNRNCEYVPFKVYKEGEGLLEPRDFQIKTVQNLLIAGSGIADLATNAGKTGCMTGLIAAYAKEGRKITIMCGMVNLLDQIKEEIERSLNITLGAITSKNKTISQVTIIMVPTVSRLLKRVDSDSGNDVDMQVFDHINETDIFICDEAHHAVATTYRKILDLNTSAGRFGMSGTVYDDDQIKGIELREIFGEVAYTVTNKELIDREISAKPIVTIIEYDTPGLKEKVKVFKSQIRNKCFKKQFQGLDEQKKPIIKLVFSIPMYTNKVKEFVMNYSVKHNKAFWEIVKDLMEKHKDDSVVVITDWVDFAKDISEYLGAIVFHGKTKKRAELIDNFKTGKIKHLVVTSVLDEGLSIDRIKVIILASVGSSVRQFKQRIGRGLRKKLDDNTLMIYDFWRFGHDYLTEPSKKRIRLWRDEGFEVRFEDD